MPVLSRYDADTDAVMESALGRYDATSSDSDSTSGSTDASMQSSELGSESSDYSEGSDSDAAGYTRGRVDMNLQYLQSFHAVASNKKK